MTSFLTAARFLLLGAALALSACAAPVSQAPVAPLLALPPASAPTPEMQVEIAKLTAGILEMGQGIDPEEAARAARIAYTHTAVLKEAYQITDGPIIHNIKVNNGTKPRGLCWHWAEDLENRLAEEDFQTLDLHRAIANYDNWRLEHSTVIVSAKGDAMDKGMVLDPWRFGGRLFWSAVTEDRRYAWAPRQFVFDWKRERGLLTVRYVQAAGG